MHSACPNVLSADRTPRKQILHSILAFTRLSECFPVSVQHASDSQRMDCGWFLRPRLIHPTTFTLPTHPKSDLLLASFCYSAGEGYWEDQTGICSSQGNGPGVHRWSGDCYRRPCHARLCGDSCTTNGCKVCGG